jgi:hypothetical protein
VKMITPTEKIEVIPEERKLEAGRDEDDCDEAWYQGESKPGRESAASHSRTRAFAAACHACSTNATVITA